MEMQLIKFSPRPLPWHLRNIMMLIHGFQLPWTMQPRVSKVSKINPSSLQ
ncbi:hypothetical protein CFP56_005550 [Quercus suber]|uniref:Uncharacterized protein n=1 Tax=Quercus suber TaxID=58331 RepID=A0AAW0L8W9_QUESU